MYKRSSRAHCCPLLFSIRGIVCCLLFNFCRFHRRGVSIFNNFEASSLIGRIYDRFVVNGKSKIQNVNGLKKDTQSGKTYSAYSASELVYVFSGF